MASEVNGWSKLEQYVLLSGQQVIVDMHRVLPIKEQHMFFDHYALHLVMPNWQAILQAKLRQIAGYPGEFLRFTWLDAANLDHSPIGQPNALGQVIEHDHASHRSRQRGNQQPVIPPRDTSGNRTRGITPQAVSRQPFSAQ